MTRKVSIPPQTMFDVMETISVRDFIDGSARLALQTDPPFAKYTFVEKNKLRFDELQKLRVDFPHLAAKIKIVNSDANAFVQSLCSFDWLSSYRRGVMFLDPYGAQLSWKTLEGIAKTKAIDTWILFPIGTVNRLLNRDGKIMEGRRKRLDALFGETAWFDRFYCRREDTLAFVSDPRYKKVASFEVITKYFLDRLKTCFSAVAPSPRIFRNSANSAIFLLCFAAGNPKGAPIAVRIAQHILGKKQYGLLKD